MSAPTTKRLRATADATRYMRTWFDGLQERVDNGGWYVLVDADAPQELFRAMGIDYVVTQWWSALLSAKQLGPAALAELRSRGLPDTHDQYNSIPLGAAFLDREVQPWGGLPAPRRVVGGIGPDAHGGLLQVWSDAHGAEVFGFERGMGGDGTLWWDRIANDWEKVVGSERLDLMQGQLTELTRWCEDATGEVLEEQRLADVLDKVNQQAQWNRRSRDLLAAARPTPIDVADTIPAVMLPQWHRGTAWAVDAAHALHDEIAEAIDAAASVVPDEQIRLMWVGRGLWFDPGFLQRFSERGVVFVWSMYHALAADAYERYGEDLQRTIAARFAPFADVLGAPGWVDEWYIHEAKRSGVDGVVHLPANGHRSAYLTTVALRESGVPVLELDGDNADARSWDGQAAADRIEAFVDREVEPVAAVRREGERQ